MLELLNMKVKSPKLILLASMLLLLTILSLMIPNALLARNSGQSSGPLSITQAGPTKLPTLGIDCGLGAKEAVVNNSGYPVAPFETGPPPGWTLKSACNWIGDVGATALPPGDTTTEPLVSDQDEAYSPSNPSAICVPAPGTMNCGKIGGGFTADIVYLQNSTSKTNGFDITVSWNPNILRAQTIDQGGTNWGALAPFVTKSIDNTIGRLRTVQVIFANYGLNFTFFRIRFDVIGIGSTGLSISNDVITNPYVPSGAVVHQTIQGSFDSESYFDPTHTLSWSGGFTFSPNPLVPGTPTTFTSTVACLGCTAPLKYSWQFNSTNTLPFKIEAVGSSTAITMPNATFFGNRVTLRVLDNAMPKADNVTVVQSLPLTVAIQGPANLGVDTGATWNGFWLGGIANYAVSWRFCPGTATNTLVCSKPVASIASQPGQNSTQTLSGSPVGYHFAGSYNVSLTVTDSGSGSLAGGTAKGYSRVNVTGVTPAFTVQAMVNTQNATAGFPVTVTSSITYSNSFTGPGLRSILFAYTIYWGDGTSSVVTNTGFTTPYPASTSHNYTAAANYPITVVAQDMQSPSQIRETGFATVSVASVVTGDFSLSTTSIVTGQSVSFTSTISGGVPPYTYFWDYGDGSTDTGASTAHTFARSGNYTVTVTVTDSGGRKLYKTHTVTVSQASSPPPLVANSLLIYAGAAAAAVAAVAALLLLRRKRARRATLT